MNKLKAIFTDRRMLIVFSMGFASGLPLLLTASTLQAWFKESGMDLTSIGMLSLVGMPYTLKFLWSPALDWLVPPFLGRRRGWLMISQIALMAALVGMAFSSPAQSTMVLASFALLVALFSATQDIGIDAYQLEILPTESYGLGNQIYILGYRVGMVLAGSGALIVADHASWTATYLVMAGAMGIGIVTTLLAPEPKAQGLPRTFVEAVWLPLKDFFAPSGSHKGKVIWVLGFFLLYKIGGDLASTMTMPFYLELGYTKTQVGTIAKAFGLWATIVGGLIGGAGVIFLGLRRSLWIFGIMQAIGYLSFAWLGKYVAATGVASLGALGTAIAIENLAAGLGIAAYSTYMGSIVNKKYTATQYALLSSLMAVPRVFGSAPSGYLATQFGWFGYFVFCALVSIPGLLILFRLNTETSSVSDRDSDSVESGTPQQAPIKNNSASFRSLGNGGSTPVSSRAHHNSLGPQA